VDSIEKQILIGGRYTLRDPLGSGGMAEVFLAYEEVRERNVALKILKEQYADDEGFVEHFRREAQSAASLNHPNIVRIYYWGGTENGEAYYIAMEYAPGGTLEDVVLEDGALPPYKAVEVASQIAEALRFAHERGVIHRDIKPQNILLSALGDAKVTDFGLARAAYSTSLSQTSLVLGTASYMSPEQAMGGPVDPRSDLYSLGVVLYEMLTGELPYEGDSSVTIAVKHVMEPPRAPGEVNSEVPEGISALTYKLLAKDPGDRYTSATQLIKDLRRVRDGLPPAFAPGSRQRTARSPLRVTRTSIRGECMQHCKELESEPSQEDYWNSGEDSICDLQCGDSLAIAANRIGEEVFGARKPLLRALRGLRGGRRRGAA
jgi:serine/threonine-protein kinase